MESSQYFGMLERQKQATLDAQRFKGQRATNKISRQGLLFQFGSHVSRPSGDHMVRTCFIGYAYPPSTTFLTDLKPVFISDLKLETHHTGAALIVRTLGHPHRILAVQNAVEDAEGNVDRLALYNGDPKLDPQDVLARGAVFAIKEPFYKKTADGGYTIRVDHPSDLVRIQASHPMVPAKFAADLQRPENCALAWKTNGNSAYKKKDYISAIDMYTVGLSSCTDGDDLLKYDLLRNRAIANIYLQRYENAKADAIAALIPDPCSDERMTNCNAKAYYRAGCAAYRLAQFEEAELHFEESRKLDPQDVDVVSELKRTASRLSEQAHGDYDFTTMSASATKMHTRLDHASYTAKVAVRDAGGRGRGLFASEAIKAGDLILCEKAFSVALATDAKAETYVVLNLNTNHGAMGAHANLLFNLVQKLLHNTHEAARFFDLFAGGYTPLCTAQVVDGLVAVDTFHAEAIVEHNAFGCPDVISTAKEETQEKSSDALSSTGIWITASYANHTCDGNARRAFIGDMMIMRATKEIKKDEEIFMPYRLPDAVSSETQKQLQKAWKFKCQCGICTAEQKSPSSQRERRQVLFSESKTFLENHRQSSTFRPDVATIRKAENMYSTLEATYDKHLFKDVPRLALVDLGRWLCTAYHTGFTPGKVEHHALEVLRNLGYGTNSTGKVLRIDRAHCTLDLSAIDAAMYAAQTCHQQGKSKRGKQFESFAKESYQVLFGTMTEFGSRYGPGHENL